MDPYARASKIRRFGPLASAANRNLLRDNPKSPLDKISGNGQQSPATLSTEVQRSLLHIGMKVRKSVLIGYKTGLDALEQALDGPGAQRAGSESSLAAQPSSTARQTSTIITPRLAFDGDRCFQSSNQLPNGPLAARKKRSLDDATDTPPSPKDTDMQIDSDPAISQDKYDRKIRRFAVPRSRRTNSVAVQPMDLDPFIYVDEQGDFADADFLVGD